ncbi:MAG: EpsG family protein [Thalassovita sp.]
MSTYLVVFTVISLLGLSIPDRRSLATLLTISLFMAWFMGTRYIVGCDFKAYFLRYNDTLPGIYFSEIFAQQEPGFALMSAILKTLGAHYMWVNITASVLMVLGYFIFARAHRSSIMIMALLFPVIIVQLGMSGIRQGVAVSALMVASVFFMQGRGWMTALAILLGAQFHSSVIMFLPLAFLAGRKVSIGQIAIGVLLLTPVAVYLLSDRLDVYSDRYIEQNYGAITSGGAIIRYGLIMIPQVFFLAYYRRIRDEFPEVYGLLKLFAIICFSLMPLAVYSSIALHRINFYVMPFSILTFVYLSWCIFPRSQVLLGRALPALTYGLYQMSWFMTSSHAEACYNPYRSFSFLLLTGG